MIHINITCFRLFKFFHTSLTKSEDVAVDIPMWQLIAGWKWHTSALEISTFKFSLLCIASLNISLAYPSCHQQSHWDIHQYIFTLCIAFINITPHCFQDFYGFLQIIRWSYSWFMQSSMTSLQNSYIRGDFQYCLWHEGPHLPLYSLSTYRTLPHITSTIFTADQVPTREECHTHIFIHTDLTNLHLF